jgi:putative Ca2+/H+ antiporter (TMEM165/GDT1 family)
MLIAGVPAVFMGEVLAKRIPMQPIRYIAAILFIALVIATLFHALILTA